MDTESKKASMVRRSTTVRFFRWLFRWRTLGGIAFVLFCLLTVGFLILVEENWRGRRAWDKFRAEQEAKGERFDFGSFLPKPAPPEQNFAMTPLLAPLLDYQIRNGDFEWRDSNALARAQSVSISQRGKGSEDVLPQGNWQRGEFCNLSNWQAFYRENTNYPVTESLPEPGRGVLAALKKYEPVLAELRTASERPYSVFPVHYHDGSGLLLQHLSVLKGLSQLAQLHALAGLEAGRSDDALADVKLGFFLAQSIRAEPILISHLVRLAIVQLTLQPVWEGQARHQWSDVQLQELQKIIASVDLLCDFAQALRGERAFNLETMRQMRAGGPDANQVPKALRSLMPTGWLYQNQVVIARAYEQVLLPVVDPAKRRVYPEHRGTNQLLSVLGKRTPYNIFAWMLLPALERSSARFAQGQMGLDLAMVGCALERFRLSHGQLPESLGELVPQFIGKVPNDIMDGQFLRYRKQSDTSYLLYSVGWNQADDGGEIALTKSKPPRLDFTHGDWVWKGASGK